MPLAKFEQGRKFPEDSTIAYPYLHSGMGIAWRVHDDVSVNRKLLSDEFLQPLEGLPGPSLGQ